METHRLRRTNRPFALTLGLAGIFLVSCNGGGGSTPTSPVPAIANINTATDPSSPVTLPIEINGSNFTSAPGKVVFTQSPTNITASVVPNAAGWTDSGIVATVPAGDGTNAFTVPGSVTVTVETSGGTSNGVSLSLVQPLTFQANNVTWTTTTPLPTALSGLRAVAVPVDDTTAYIVVAGGYALTGNTTNVYSNTLAPSGYVGPAWVLQAGSLPAPRAHHAMVEADPGNSPVPSGSRFIYVLGGQERSTDFPGGMTTVFMASVDVNSGQVGAWTQLSIPLPEPLMGLTATVINGFIYVAGGLRPNGTPTPNVYSAPINADGTLGTWSTATSSYSPAVSFATAFGYAGKLYVLGGDSGPSSDPNEQGNPGVYNVNYASTQHGVLGVWTPTAPTIKRRKKQVTWVAFGQVIDAEGIYDAPSLELERTTVNPDSTLAPWLQIAGSANQTNAYVYNAAAVVSPLASPAATPRFLLLGGQAFAGVNRPAGLLRTEVYYNNAP